MNLVILTDTTLPPIGVPVGSADKLPPLSLSREKIIELADAFPTASFVVRDLLSELPIDRQIGPEGSSWYIAHSGKLPSSCVQNAILVATSPRALSTTVLPLLEKTSGWLDLLVPQHWIASDEYRYSLELELQKIVDFVKTSSSPLGRILQLQASSITQKFANWGETSLFVSPDLQVYYHPGCYYIQLPALGDLRSLDLENSDLIHPSRPHLACLACETLYCDRNVVYNKVKTTEFKVPAADQCALTELFVKFQHQLYPITAEIPLKPFVQINEDIWDAGKAHQQIADGEISANAIKQTGYDIQLATVRQRNMNRLASDILTWIQEDL